MLLLSSGQWRVCEKRRPRLVEEDGEMLFPLEDLCWKIRRLTLIQSGPRLDESPLSEYYGISFAHLSDDVDG